MSKIKAKLKPWNSLSGNWTKACNTMIYHIKDAYEYKVYMYLCTLYNSNFNYAFPSYKAMAKDLQMSVKKAQLCIKSLCESGYIVKAKYWNGHHYNNIYYIRYLELDEQQVGEVLTTEIEIEFELDKMSVEDMLKEVDVEIEV